MFQRLISLCRKKALLGIKRIHKLALQQGDLATALRAATLMAKISGLLHPQRVQEKEVLHLHEMSDEQLRVLLEDTQANLEESPAIHAAGAVKKDETFRD